LASFLTAGRALAVLGAAGSGKTTLVRYTALDLAEQDWRPWRARFWRRRPLPVLLYLRDHTQAILADPDQDGHRIDLAEAAVTVPWLQRTVSAEWLERQLERGRCVVLLDGLDEVADGTDRKRVADWVDAQISRYPTSTFVITSRPHGYEDNRLRSADTLQVQRFTRDQIRAFLHSWYRAIEHRARRGNRAETDRVAAASAEDLFTRINALPALYDLAANPLLLTMIANVHRYRGALPEGRAALYSEMCQVLLHRRQEVRGIPHPIDEALTGAQKERIVQELAWYMMRRRLRDIPVDEAARAIRPVLDRTAPHIAPEAFLDYACHRSGLLTEHRHGHYAFAHLTLQEYLAAALVPDHHTRRQHLVQNVSDPWWRETTLLWAANADASSVVEACLAENTVASLSLAYDCVGQARELDSELRDRLDRILDAAPASSEQARLLDGVAATRALHESHLLDGGSRLCARPLSRDLWNRYAAHTGLPALPPSGTESATGLRPVDIHGFLSWLNGLFTDGTTYRLPTLDEARQALHLHHEAALWASAGDQTTLVFTGSHPYQPTLQQVSAYPNLILDHTHLILRLMRPCSSLSFTQLLVYALPRNLADPLHRLLHVLDLICVIRTAHNLDRDPARDRTHNHTQFLAPGLTLVLNRADNHPLSRELTHELTFIINRAVDPDHDSGLALSRAFVRARTLALDLARDLGLDLALARTLDHDLGFDLEHDFALALALSLDHDLALARRYDFDLSHGIDFAHVLDRGLNAALNRALTRRPAPDPDLDFASTLDPGLNRDLAFARAMASWDLGRFQKVPVAMAVSRACLTLIQAAGGSYASRTGRWWIQVSVPMTLSQFLAKSLRELPGRPTDDLESTLQQAETLAGENSKPQIVELIRETRTLATPLWDRRQGARQGDAVLAVVLLLAVLASDEADRPDSGLLSLVRQALLTLIALTPGTRSQEEACDSLVFLIRE